MLYIFTFVLVAFIISLRLRSDPKKKIKKQIQKKLAQATEYQRNGKLREYAEIIQEVEDLEKKQNGQ